MADQGKWFKLHVGWDDDPHISALSLQDQARWCKFGTYVKEHGTEGKITLVEPAKTLQHRFELSSFEEVLNTLKKFPNYDVGEKQKCGVSGVTTTTVTIKNWHKYQADFSRDRMRKMRALVTAKKRGEEKRGDVEEKRITSPLPPSAPKGGNSEKWFEVLWKNYPRERRCGRKIAWRHFQASVKDLDGAKRCANALEAYLGTKQVKDGFLMNASRFFNEWQDHEPERKNYEPAIQRSLPSLSDAPSDARATNPDPGGGSFTRADRVLARTTNLVHDAVAGQNGDRAGGD